MIIHFVSKKIARYWEAENLSAGADSETLSLTCIGDEDMWSEETEEATVKVSARLSSDLQNCLLDTFP